MGRIYTAEFEGLVSAASLDLLQIEATSAIIVVIHEFGISQLADVGDAEEEMLLLQWKRGVADGSGGLTTGETSILPGDPSAVAYVEYGNTSKSTGGTPGISWYWNIRVPFQHVFTPETRPILAPSDRGVLTQATTPNDSITYGGYVMFEEIG